MLKSQRQRPKKAKRDEDIDNIINQLHLAETNSQGQHIGASAKPLYEETLANKEQNLDSLARLLTGREICTSVCYFDKQLVVASNKATPAYGKSYLSLLKAYINKPFKENYQNLAQECNNQIEYIIKDIRQNEKNLNVQSGKLDKKIDNAISRNDITYVELTKAVINNDIKSIKHLGNVIIQDKSSSIQSRELAIDLLRPMIDMHIITRALESREELDNEIILAIKNDKIKYLQSSPTKHAEMKILDEIKEPGVYYIGISKLTCFPCHAALVLFNKGNNGIKICVSGTHGGTYPSWEAPDWTIATTENKKQFLEYVMKEAGNYFKSREAHPYSDYFIPQEPVLAKYVNLEEARKALQEKTELKKIQDNIIFNKELLGNLQEEKNKIEKERQEIQNSLSEILSEIQLCKNQKIKFETELASSDRAKQVNEQAMQKFKNLGSYEEVREFINEYDKALFNDKSIRDKLRSTKDEKIKKQIWADEYAKKLGIKNIETDIKKLSSKNESFKKDIIKSEEKKLELEKQREIINTNLTKQDNEINTVIENIKSLQFQKTTIAEHTQLLQKILVINQDLSTFKQDTKEEPKIIQEALQLLYKTDNYQENTDLVTNQEQEQMALGDIADATEII